MKPQFHLSIPLVLMLFLIGCGGESPTNPTAPSPTESRPTVVPPTEPQPEPTDAPPPTESPTESPTETPVEIASGPFRDDFDGGLDASWSWINEDPSRWQITDDGWLQITGDNPPFAPETIEIPMVNVLTRPVPQGGDIAVSTHIIADPDENFEQAALFLIEDGDSYAILNFGFCSFCTNKSVYLEAYADGQPLLEGLQSFQLPEDQTEVWLRIEYSPDGNALVAMVAVEEGTWQRVGSIVREPPAISVVAIGAANVPGPGANPDEDLIALFDYLEIEVYD